MNDKIKKAAPFFIVGSPRSGTTLLEQILNRHSALFIPPETEFFLFLSNLRRSSRDDVSEDGLRRTVDLYIKQPAFQFLEVGSAKAYETLLTNAADYTDVFNNLMAFLLKRSGKTRWGEKTPSHLRLIKEIVQYIPDSKFIALVRDGRAVVKSRMKHPRWGGNLYFFAKRWSKDARILDKTLNALGEEKVLVLKYEDVLSDPKSSIERVCHFLGEEYEAKTIQAQENTNAEFDKYYSQSWMSKSTSQIDATRKDSWKKEYADAELALVENLIASELTAFGYELTQPKATTHLVFAKYYLIHLAIYIHKIIRRALKCPPKSGQVAK